MVGVTALEATLKKDLLIIFLDHFVTDNLKDLIDDFEELV